MKLGDIKIAALNLMNASIDIELRLDNLEEYEANEQFSIYLKDMPDCINRCFGRFENASVVPTKDFEIKASDNLGTKGECYTKYDIRSLISDLCTIEQVDYEDGYLYEENVDFRTQGSKLILPNLMRGSYIVIYTPVISRITSETPNSEEIDLPENLACLVPLFIKSELYEKDEPSLATLARNKFESELDTFKPLYRQTYVEGIY